MLRGSCDAYWQAAHVPYWSTLQSSGAPLRGPLRYCLRGGMYTVVWGAFQGYVTCALLIDRKGLTVDALFAGSVVSGS